MANIDALAKWSPVRVLEQQELARGGINGNMNEQAKSLAERTEFLKENSATKDELNSIFESVSNRNYSFKTLAEFEAIKDTIIPNSTVTIDEEGQYQGDNIWDGITLTKSSYDPLLKAKNYIDESIRKVENFAEAAAYKENGKLKVGNTVGMFYQKKAVFTGEKYLIRSQDYNLSKAWYAVDNDNNILIECNGFPSISSEIVTIPQDCFYLYVNCPNSAIQDFKFEKLSEYDFQTVELTGKYPVENKIAYISDNRSPAKLIRVGSENVKSIVVNDLKVGDQYKIDAKQIGDVKSYYFVSDDYTIVSSENHNESDLKFITVPQYATKLIVCSDITYVNFSVLKANYFDILAYEAVRKSDQREIGIAYISNNESRAKAIRVGSPSVITIVISDIKIGELIKVDSRKIGIVRSYYFVSDDFTIVSNSNDNDPDLKFLKVPQYATKLIACSDISYENFSVEKADYFGNLAYEASLKPDPTVKKNLKDYYPQQPNYRHLLQDKCPKFYNKLRNKTDDLTVCMTGTSLAQGNLYTTSRSDAITRPPLLHTNDLSSHIFDSLIGYWHGQQYRRYDHVDLNYSASTWNVINTLKDGSNNDVWDDYDYKKNGLTKTTTSANASVSTEIPVGAWQFNFIYRTDSQCGNCTVSIAEGNSKVEVFNGVNWVEANGFVFSMLESAVTETKGNTCYQKRLKMRCKNKASGGIDSLKTAKNITISKGNNANRFNVVGFEWSPREYMLTFINAARGSHAWGLTDSPVNLENFQDSDIWEFNPDLILCEVTAINWGAGFGQALKTDPNYYVNIAKKAYFEDLGEGWTNSLYQKSNKYTKCEIIFFGDTVATSVDYDMLWDENKQPKFGLVETPAYNGSASTENVGRVKTIFENYEAVETYVASKSYIFIPVSQQFKKLADSAFGNYPDAFAPTLANGDSLSFDRVHLNDNGAAFYAYLIKPLFENL